MGSPRSTEGTENTRVESSAVASAKGAYQTACANEWPNGLCEKHRVKWAECPCRRFLPITDEVLR